jgi:tRNA-2-methylthio-N6-dimethylallyladenosine synthase
MFMLSGDIIVGFPTETDEDFQRRRTARAGPVQEQLHLQVLPRPGTVAYDKITDDVPDEVKRQRNNELLAVQARISEASAGAGIDCRGRRRCR